MFLNGSDVCSVGKVKDFLETVPNGVNSVPAFYSLNTLQQQQRNNNNNNNNNNVMCWKEGGISNGQYRYTLLHFASMFGKEETIRVLRQHGVDMKLKDRAGRTAYDLAVEMRQRQSILNLLKIEPEVDTGVCGIVLSPAIKELHGKLVEALKLFEEDHGSNIVDVLALEVLGFLKLRIVQNDYQGKMTASKAIKRVLYDLVLTQNLLLRNALQQLGDDSCSVDIYIYGNDDEGIDTSTWAVTGRISTFDSLKGYLVSNDINIDTIPRARIDGDDRQYWMDANPPSVVFGWVLGSRNRVEARMQTPVHQDMSIECPRCTFINKSPCRECIICDSTLSNTTQRPNVASSSPPNRRTDTHSANQHHHRQNLPSPQHISPGLQTRGSFNASESTPIRTRNSSTVTEEPDFYNFTPWAEEVDHPNFTTRSTPSAPSQRSFQSSRRDQQSQQQSQQVTHSEQPLDANQEELLQDLMSPTRLQLHSYNDESPIALTVAFSDYLAKLNIEYKQMYMEYRTNVELLYRYQQGQMDLPVKLQAIADVSDRIRDLKSNIGADAQSHSSEFDTLLRKFIELQRLLEVW